MNQDPSLRKAVVTVIVGALVAAIVFLAVGWLVPAAVLAGLAIILGLELATTAFQVRKHGRLSQALFEKATDQAQHGRKLVIYERETGLFAHWYIALRCEEECYRARRYEHGLTLVVIEPASGSEDPWATQDYVANWLRRQLRKADLAAYLGNGSFVVVMPQSEQGVAHAVIDRLRAEIEGIEVGVSSFPEDGSDFEELLASAKGRLRQTVEPAA